MEPLGVEPRESKVVHQLLLAVFAGAFVVVCSVRFTIVESPELTPFLPLPGGADSSGMLLSEHFCCFDTPGGGNGLNPFSHSFRCRRNTAIVALASVTCTIFENKQGGAKDNGKLTLECSPPWITTPSSCFTRLRRAGRLPVILCFAAKCCVSRMQGPGWDSNST